MRVRVQMLVRVPVRVRVRVRVPDHPPPVRVPGVNPWRASRKMQDAL